jgi:hypothetical protein
MSGVRPLVLDRGKTRTSHVIFSGLRTGR